MYRPTVRYNEIFREYVDQLFHLTELDRNQVFRLALFMLGNTKEGKEELDRFSRQPLPPTPWRLSDRGLWLRNTDINVREEGRQERDVRLWNKQQEGETSGGIYINLS